MSSEGLEKLFEEYSGVVDSTERAEISYALLGRIASGMENKDSGYEQIATPMNTVWVEASKRIDKVLAENPSEGFRLALDLALLPVSSDPKLEAVRKWMRGDGPAILSRPEVHAQLQDYLETDNASNLVSKLKSYMSYDFSKPQNAEEAFADANCFLALGTILMGMNLQDLSGNPKAQELFEKAKDRLGDRRVREVVAFYSTEEDTKWLAKALFSFELEKNE